MVAGKNNECIIGVGPRLQCVQYSSNLSVHKSHAGKVGLCPLAKLLLAAVLHNLPVLLPAPRLGNVVLLRQYF